MNKAQEKPRQQSTWLQRNPSLCSSVRLIHQLTRSTDGVSLLLNVKTYFLLNVDDSLC